MKSKIKAIFLSFFLFFSSFLLMPIPAHASLSVCGGTESTTSIAAFNSGSGSNKGCQLSDIFVLIARVANFLIGAAGVFAVFMIVYSGFQMVTSFGNEKSYGTARKHLTNAVIGFILVMIAFMVINTVFLALQSAGILPSNTSLGINFNQILIK